MAVIGLLFALAQASGGVTTSGDRAWAGTAMPSDGAIPADGSLPQSQGNGGADAAILPAPASKPAALPPLQGGDAQAALPPAAPSGRRQALPAPPFAADPPAILRRATLRLRGPPDTA